MIFRVRRASGFPVALEVEEIHTLDVLEKQMRWIELEDFERQLRHSEDMKEINVEANLLEEVIFWLSSMHTVYPITIDFEKKTMVIQDNGDIIN